jgi:hypothetical protein
MSTSMRMRSAARESCRCYLHGTDLMVAAGAAVAGVAAAGASVAGAAVAGAALVVAAVAGAWAALGGMEASMTTRTGAEEHARRAREQPAHRMPLPVPNQKATPESRPRRRALKKWGCG